MRIAALLFVLLVLSAPVLADESVRPVGQNCNLSGPPDGAGEEFNHGITLRIYPRARNIDSKYSGCQSMWAPDKDRWTLVSLVAIQSGDPIRLWSPHASDPARMGCIYEKGKVVKGDADKCAGPQFLIERSLAPGCVEMIRKAVTKDGLGAPSPSGCDYE